MLTNTVLFLCPLCKPVPDVAVPEVPVVAVDEDDPEKLSRELVFFFLPMLRGKKRERGMLKGNLQSRKKVGPCTKPHKILGNPTNRSSSNGIIGPV